jgi:hypothetical protein
VTRHYVPRHQPLAYTNGVQLSHVEVDVDTGFVTLLGHWVAEDCGRVINPMLVAEQVRGGVAHGIGDALFEHCIYDEQGQLVTTTMMDYLVPMAVEMPPNRGRPCRDAHGLLRGRLQGGGRGRGRGGAGRRAQRSQRRARPVRRACHAGADDARGDPPRAREGVARRIPMATLTGLGARGSVGPW